MAREVGDQRDQGQQGRGAGDGVADGHQPDHSTGHGQPDEHALDGAGQAHLARHGQQVAEVAGVVEPQPHLPAQQRPAPAGEHQGAGPTGQHGRGRVAGRPVRRRDREPDRQGDRQAHPPRSRQQRGGDDRGTDRPHRQDVVGVRGHLEVGEARDRSQDGESDPDALDAQHPHAPIPTPTPCPVSIEPASSGARAGRLAASRPAGSDQCGQIDAERRADALGALDAHRAAVLVDHGVRDRQPQPTTRDGLALGQ